MQVTLSEGRRKQGRQRTVRQRALQQCAHHSPGFSNDALASTYSGIPKLFPTRGLTNGHSVGTAAINGEVFIWKALHKPTNGGLRPVKRKGENAVQPISALTLHFHSNNV